jgi:fatty-acyl-CoA synthase
MPNTMLSINKRSKYETLLDAQSLQAKDSQKIAFIYLQTDQEPIVVTRAQFRLQVIVYAYALTQHGIEARDLVVIAHTQNLESIYLFWALLYLGAIPSMFPTLTEKLDSTIYMNNIAELVKLSDVKAVFTTAEFAPKLKERVACAVFGTENLADVELGETVSFHKSNPKQIALLQHSSGTTGLQKGVALSHVAILNQLASYSTALHLNENDIIVSWLPLYHDMGLIAGFLLPIIQGIPLVLMSPFDWVSHPSMLLKAIHDYKATLTWLPNFAYNHLARRVRQRDTEGISLTSMRAFINCSEPVRADSHALFLERFMPNGVIPEMLQVSYAMAENTFAVTQTVFAVAPTIDYVHRQDLQEKRLATPVGKDDPMASPQVSCGKPIANTSVKVLDDQNQVLAERQVGEILVKSDCMLNSYYKRDDLQPFDDEGWYRTGDQGYMVEGEVYVIGRSKDLIINAGKNVYPQDLEAIVNDIEGVHAGRAVAFGVMDEKEGTELIAIVAEVTTADPEERKKIGQRIRQTVGQYTDVTVNFVKLVDSGWLIKTSSGKISRGKNRDKWLQEQA